MEVQQHARDMRPRGEFRNIGFGGQRREAGAEQLLRGILLELVHGAVLLQQHGHRLELVAPDDEEPQNEVAMLELEAEALALELELLAA